MSVIVSLFYFCHNKIAMIFSFELNAIRLGIPRFQSTFGPKLSLIAINVVSQKGYLFRNDFKYMHKLYKPI